MPSETTATNEPVQGVTTLAFRAQQMSQSEREMLEAAQRRQVYFLLAVPATMAIGYVLGHFSLGAVMPVLTTLSIVAIGAGLLFFKAYRFPLVILPLWILGGVLLSSVASWLFVSRTVTTVILGAASLALVFFQGAKPLEFYREWLLTDPRMDDGTRTAGTLPRVKPSWWFLAAMLAVIIIVPRRHSVTLAIAMVLLGSIGFILTTAFKHPAGWRAGLRSLLRDGRFLQHLFLAYPDASETKPGQWTPRLSQMRRKALSSLFTGSISMVLVVGLSFCCPWELVASLTAGRSWWRIPPEAEHAHDWLVAPFDPIQTGGAVYSWVFVIGFVLIFTLPSLLLLAMYAPALAKLRQAAASGKDANRAPRSDWDVFVERLRNSTHSEEDPETGEELRESDHLFMGVFRSTGAPVLLHRRILDEHMYIAGQTGAGKTALGIVPLLTQLIRSGGDRPCPILILDLKGDLALFNTAREEAAARKNNGVAAPQETMLFRTDQGYATNYFNPFRDFASAVHPRRAIETTELFIQALSLFHGDFYGASYYSKQHRDVLLSALREAEERKDPPKNFEELYETVVRYAASAGDRGRDAVELLATIHAVSQYEQLGDPPKGVESIHMPEVIRKGQLAYFWLPSQLTGMTVRETGKLALYAFLTAMQEYKQSAEAAGDERRGYIIIDEFQRIAAENVRVILQQARSFGVSVILANQDPTDLKLPNADLRSTVYTNTRVKQFFSLTDPHEIESLEKLSGEELDWTATESESVSATFPYGVLQRNVGRKQVFRSRFKADDARTATDLPNDSILFISRGRGFTQLQGIPQAITTPWPTSREDYQRRLTTPWPRVEVRPGTATNKTSPDTTEVRTKKKADEFTLQLEQLLERQRQAEMFDTDGDESEGAPGPRRRKRPPPKPSPKSPKPPPDFPRMEGGDDDA